MPKSSHLNPGMDLPTQGAYRFEPLILFFEDTSMVGLKSQLYARVGVMDTNPAYYYVLHSVQYQVTSGVGMDMNYSACVHITLAEKI